MPDHKARRTLAILNLLGLYILLQVLWWGYLLVSVTRNLAEAEGNADYGVRQAWMIAGEGSVFLVLLFVGFRRIRKNIRRDLHFAGMQRTFLLAVTHELKTPVAAVKLLLETLHNREVTAEQSKKMIADALKETNRLEGLTGNILLATRLDQGNSESEKTPTDLSAILKVESSRFANLYQGLRVFSVEIEPEVQVSGEPELLRAVCFNLIENAVKYSEKEGLITVSLRHQKDEVTLVVSDTGCGIPDEEKDRIFGKFYRPGNEQTRRHKGTGLGLYIVASALRLHGGRISVTDNQPQGSTFTVRLPLSHGTLR
jgi:signal transduction histidine kinase